MRRSMAVLAALILALVLPASAYAEALVAPFRRDGDAVAVVARFGMSGMDMVRREREGRLSRVNASAV